MSVSLTIPVILAASQTGLTLAPVLLNADGTPAAGLTTTSLVEIGGGNYLWVGTVPDGHVGGVKFSSGATLKAFAAVDARTPTAALSGEQAAQLETAAAEIVKVPRVGMTTRHSRNGEAVDVTLEEAP